MARFGEARRLVGKERPFKGRHFRTAVRMTDDANARAERVFIARNFVRDEAFGREIVGGGRLIGVVVGVVKGLFHFDPEAPVEDVPLGVGERNVERPEEVVVFAAFFVRPTGEVVRRAACAVAFVFGERP